MLSDFNNSIDSKLIFFMNVRILIFDQVTGKLLGKMIFYSFATAQSITGKFWFIFPTFFLLYVGLI